MKKRATPKGPPVQCRLGAGVYYFFDTNMALVFSLVCPA